MPKNSPYLTPAAFDFLRDLAANNDRAWFKDNKDRYHGAVRDPMLRLIEDFQPRLRSINKHFIADPKPVGGSLFRIHRDTRFSKDKSPYKTNAGAHFRHESAKDAHAPGFYFHLEPDNCFAAAGLWHPDGPTLGLIRDSIIGRSRAWKEITKSDAFQTKWFFGGDSLSRPPRGYDADHPLIDDLKRKDFIGVTSLSEETVFADDFIDQLEALYRDVVPLVRFLTKAVNVAW